jgi:tRNA (guanine26-N2/guanine27-N2)-dimethyltransferase
MVSPEATCPHCNKPLLPIGPLYLGKLFDDEILGQMQEHLAGMTLGTKKELLKILTLCREELPTSSFYDYHMLAQKLATSPPAIDAVIERLRAAGYAASRTHFSGTGVKTDAPLPGLLAAIGKVDKKDMIPPWEE